MRDATSLIPGRRRSCLPALVAHFLDSAVQPRPDQEAAIVDNKHLGQTLAAIRDVQAKRGPGRRNIAEPSRSAQERHMFIVPQPDAEEGRLAAAFALADAIKALEVPPRKQRGRLPLPRRPRDQ